MAGRRRTLTGCCRALGLTKTGTGTYTLAAGTPSAVTTALDALIFAPTAHQLAPGGTITTGMTLSVSDGIIGSPVADTATTVVATAINDAPAITGTTAGPGGERKRHADSVLGGQRQRPRLRCKRDRHHRAHRWAGRRRMQTARCRAPGSPRPAPAPTRWPPTSPPPSRRHWTRWSSRRPWARSRRAARSPPA